MKLMKYFLVIFIICTAWFQRHIFFDTYDHVYMQKYYELSQWSFVNSSRVMGDADLYTYAGYNIIQDFKPFTINPEAPIFAKLFFGASILLFNNTHYASIFFIILLLKGTDTLAKKHFNFSKNKRLLLAILVFCSAEIQEQVTHTLLDLPQVMLFVWHLVYLFEIKKNKSNIFKSILLSGLMLGFMSASKVALYTPIILLADIWYLYINKKLKYIFLLLFSTIVGYILPYIPTIITDGPVQFLRSQKWIFNFYISSKVKAPIAMIIITSFTGMVKGWTNHNWENVYSWNGEWGLGILALIQSLKDLFSKKIKNKELTTILISLSLIFILLIKIPFWPRYMIIFIPFFWILILNLIHDKKYLLLLLIFPIISTSKLILKSYMTPKDYLNYWQIASYEEVYNYLSTDLKDQITREGFVKGNILEYENIKPNKIEIEILDQTKTVEKTLKQTINVKLTGVFGEKNIKKEIIWTRENAQWKIANIENLTQRTKMYKENISALCMNPVRVENWSEVYSSIESYYMISTQEAKEKTTQLVPRDYCIPIGLIQKDKPITNLKLSSDLKLISNSQPYQ